MVLEPIETARNGDMVAAWIKDREETTLKHFYQESDRVRLSPPTPPCSPSMCRLSRSGFKAGWSCSSANLKLSNQARPWPGLVGRLSGPSERDGSFLLRSHCVSARPASAQDQRQVDAEPQPIAGDGGDGELRLIRVVSLPALSKARARKW